MRKKYLYVVLTVMVAGTAAGGGVWYWRRSHDQMGIAHAALIRGDLRVAQLTLRALVRDDPNNAEAHFRLGAVQLSLGDPVAAERELRLARAGGLDVGQIAPLLARAYLAQDRFADVLKDFPVDTLPPDQAAPLLVSRALAQLGLKQNDAAAATIAEAERLAPQSADALLAAARIALAREDVAGAEAKVDHALAISPRSIDALTLKGTLRRVNKDLPAAVAAFDIAIEVTPNALPLRLERADTLLAMGQDQKARDDVAIVLKADARNPTANYLQAVLLFHAKDWAGADAALQKIAPEIGRFPRGEYFAALVKTSLGQVEQATEIATHYVAHAPGDAAGYKLLAGIQSSAQRPEQAIEVLNRAFAAGVADVELLEMLGAAYTQTGQTALARQTLVRAAALANDNPRVLARIAALQVGAGDPVGAERELIRSVEIAPDKTETGEQLVMAALAAGDVTRASAALEQLKRQPKADPSKIDNLTGQVRLAQFDLAGARAAFEAVLKADPNATGTQLNLARVLILQNQDAEAETVLNAVLRREPANIAALADMARILQPRKRGDRLIELLEAARKAAPDNPAIVLAQVEVLAETGATQRGVALLDQLPKEQAELPGVLTIRARLQTALGMPREAQATYRHILATNPGNLDALGHYADLLLQANDAEGVRQTIRKGLAALPGNLKLLEASVAVDQRTDGLDSALRNAAVLAREPAQLPAARQLKGWLYMSVQRFADAASAYQAELDANPSTELAVATASALEADGRKADATHVLKGWLAGHPDDVTATQALASLDLQNRRFDEAERGLTAVLAKQPNDPTALNNLAWLYQRRSDPRARELANKAFLLAPGPQSADTLGWILVSQGSPADGLSLLRQAAEQLRNDPAVLYHFAVALNASGQRDDAIRVLTALVNAKGEFDDKPAASKLLDTLEGPKKEHRCGPGHDAAVANLLDPFPQQRAARPRHLRREPAAPPGRHRRGGQHGAGPGTMVSGVIGAGRSGGVRPMEPICPRATDRSAAWSARSPPAVPGHSQGRHVGGPRAAVPRQPEGAGAAARGRAAGRCHRRPLLLPRRRGGGVARRRVRPAGGDHRPRLGRHAVSWPCRAATPDPGRHWPGRRGDHRQRRSARRAAAPRCRAAKDHGAAQRRRYRRLSPGGPRRGPRRTRTGRTDADFSRRTDRAQAPRSDHRRPEAAARVRVADRRRGA